MAAKENVEIVREIFRAIEDRDLARLVALTDPAPEFHWPPSLPYGGISPLQPAVGPWWAETWIPLQPSKAEQTHGRAHRGGQRRRGRRALASAGHLAGRRAM